MEGCDKTKSRERIKFQLSFHNRRLSVKDPVPACKTDMENKRNVKIPGISGKIEKDIPMNESLTPDEDTVFRELARLDVEPNQIPPELFEGFLEQLANGCNLSLQRTRAALQGLIDKGIFDVIEEGKEERIQNEREILRDLLLNDPEIRELIREIASDKKSKTP